MGKAADRAAASRTGKKLGWHHHPVMNYGVLEQGELTINALDDTEKVVHVGEAVEEMVDTVSSAEEDCSAKSVGRGCCAVAREPHAAANRAAAIHFTPPGFMVRPCYTRSITG